MLETYYIAENALLHTERGAWWESKYKPEIQMAVATAMKVLNLDSPWEEFQNDPVKVALANALFSSILSCFGPNISPEMLFELNRKRFGNTFADSPTDIRFTSNHLAVTGRITQLNSEGQSTEGSSAVIHMPTFARGSDSKPTIGDLSPISITKEDGAFQLHLATPSGYMWNKQFVVLPALESGQVVGTKADKQVLLRDISLPCASSYRVLVLRPTCQEDCRMCKVTRGAGFISEEHWEHVDQTLDLQIKIAVKNNHAFQSTLSGGSISSGDGGFGTAYARALSMIEKKTTFYGHAYNRERIPVQLELEMILPLDKREWNPIIQQLKHYIALGWNISLAINMEVLQDSYKPLFLTGRFKGTTTLENHIEFAKLLKEETGGKLQMNSLIMFGMKPAAMSYDEYMAEDLRIFHELFKVGIYAEYAPLKIESGIAIEAYPPPDPIFFMIQYLATRLIRRNAKNLHYSPGCVGTCSLCHNPGEIARLISELRKKNISLPTIFAPILAQLGTKYTDAFTEYTN